MSNTATFNTSPNLKLSKKLSFGEEVANSVTHAVGAVAMLVLLPITAVHANNGYGMTAAVGMSVFVISLFPNCFYRNRDFHYFYYTFRKIRGDYRYTA